MVDLQVAHHHHRSAQRGSELGTVQAVPGGSSWVEAPGGGAQRCRIGPILDVNLSMDWFEGKFTGNHRFFRYIWGFPVIFPLNQSIESRPNRFLTKLYTLNLPDIYIKYTEGRPQSEGTQIPSKAVAKRQCGGQYPGGRRNVYLQTFKPWTWNLQTFNPDTKRANANAGRREKHRSKHDRGTTNPCSNSCSCACCCCCCCCCCRRGLQSLLHVHTWCQTLFNKSRYAS